MKIYKFDKANGKRVSNFNSDFIMSRIVQTTTVSNIGCMYLEEKGVIGYHQAIVPQLLLILNGEGYVRGYEEKYFKVQPGDAVFWEKDEWHETMSETGLTAIVIESEELDPSSLMNEKCVP